MLYLADGRKRAAANKFLQGTDRDVAQLVLHRSLMEMGEGEERVREEEEWFFFLLFLAVSGFCFSL